MASTGGAGGGKLFGLPRNAAIAAVAVGLLLVAYFYVRSRGQSGANAQANMPQDTTGTDSATAAPTLGGTPDSGAAQASLSGADLLGAFTSSEENLIAGFSSTQNALLGGFTSQESLIENLTGGILGIAQTAQQQVGSLAASGVSSTTTINYGYPPPVLNPPNPEPVVRIQPDHPTGLRVTNPIYFPPPPTNVSIPHGSATPV